MFEFVLALASSESKGIAQNLQGRQSNRGLMNVRAILGTNRMDMAKNRDICSRTLFFRLVLGDAVPERRSPKIEQRLPRHELPLVVVCVTLMAHSLINIDRSPMLRNHCKTSRNARFIRTRKLSTGSIFRKLANLRLSFRPVTLSTKQADKY